MWKLFRSSAPKAPSGASNLHINEIVTNNSAPDTGILYTRPLESPSIGPLYSPTKPRLSGINRYWNPSKNRESQPGFPNFASHMNVCYRNSALVLLLNLPVFVNWLEQHNHGGVQSFDDCLLCALKYVSDWYWAPMYFATSNVRRFNSDSFTEWLNHFWSLCFEPPYNWWGLPHEQEDLREFVQFLLAALQRCASPQEQVQLDRLFSQAVTKRMVCGLCGKSFRNKMDVENILLLPTYGPHAAISTLDQLIEREMNSRVDWNHDACGSPNSQHPCDMSKRFKDAPEVLFINLVRHAGDYSAKDERMVAFDKELDLTRYVEKVEPNRSVRYKLVGASMHSGATPAMGHYTAMIGSEDKWYYVDDDYGAVEYSFEDIWKLGSFTPILLAYRRIDGDRSNMHIGIPQLYADFGQNSSAANTDFQGDILALEDELLRVRHLLAITIMSDRDTDQYRARERDLLVRLEEFRRIQATRSPTAAPAQAVQWWPEPMSTTSDTIGRSPKRKRVAGSLKSDEDMSDADAGTAGSEVTVGNQDAAVRGLPPSPKRSRLSNLVPTWNPSQQALYNGTGFGNDSGHDCYRNSILALLFHIPVFVNWLENDHPAEQCQRVRAHSQLQGKCLACALRDLTAVYWSTSGTRRSRSISANRPSRFWDLCKKYGWGWDHNNMNEPTGYAHDQDAKAFLDWLIDTMKTTTPSTIPALDAMFQYRVTVETRCTRCRQRYRLPTDENTTLVAGVAPPEVTEPPLKSRLHHTLGEEEIQSSCEVCGDANLGGKSSFVKTQSIKEAPEVLLVQILRFQEIPVRPGRRSGRLNKPLRKDTRVYRFGEELDLTKYLSVVDGRPGEELKYRLVAVTMHSGPLDGGHYITCARSPDDVWMRIDDAAPAIEIPFSQVVRNSMSPYVLAYVRMDPSLLDAYTTPEGTPPAESKSRETSEEKSETTNDTKPAEGTDDGSEDKASDGDTSNPMQNIPGEKDEP